jgi:uroporphyrinogen decarboxylase
MEQANQAFVPDVNETLGYVFFDAVKLTKEMLKR